MSASIGRRSGKGDILVSQKGGEQSADQITAFEDSWYWTIESEEDYRHLLTNGPKRLGDLLEAIIYLLGLNGTTAYLTMMAQKEWKS